MTVCTPDLKEERRLRAQGFESVAGLDEVGRGAWAGPVTVGVAVVRPECTLPVDAGLAPGLQDAQRGSPRGDLRGGGLLVPVLVRWVTPRRV